MPGGLIQAVGGTIVLIALADVFLTVLHARGDAGLISPRISRHGWAALRGLAQLSHQHFDRLTGLAAPLILVVIVSVWVLLLAFGFALIYWPALGSGIIAPTSAVPRDFLTALYFSGVALTTLGLGDLQPATTTYRLLFVAESGLGFSVVTLSLTYFLSIYNSIIRRNAFALEVHFMAGGTADAAELLARIGSNGDFDGTARSEVATVARELLTILQTHHAYPVVHLFHRRGAAFAPARVAMVTLDLASLIQAALDPDRYRSFIGCAAVQTLWRGGLQLIRETGRDILSEDELKVQSLPHVDAWEARFRAACERLDAAGFATVAGGAADYIRLRRSWDPYARAFAAHMGHRWQDIDPLGSRSAAGTSVESEALARG